MYRFLVGSESNPAFTLTGSSDEWGCGVLKIKDASAIDSNSAIDNSTGTNNNDPTSPSIVTQVNNELVISLILSRQAPVTPDSGYPSGTTGLFFQQCLGMESVSCGGAAWFEQASAGATGAKAWTNAIGANQDSFGITIGVQP
jgi:hypothetical protein